MKKYSRLLLAAVVIGALRVKRESIKIKEKLLNLKNNIGPDEVTHSEPSHLDLCCLPCSVEVIVMIYQSVA